MICSISTFTSCGSDNDESNDLKEIPDESNDDNKGNELLMGLLQNDETFSTYAENVRNILESLPAALSDTNCQYVKIGFYLEKAE